MITSMKRMYLLIAAFACLAIDAAFSQSKTKVDSLTAILNKYPKEDTVKARLLIELSDASIDVSDFKGGIAYSDKALAILANANAPLLKADALTSKAHNLMLMSEYIKAIEYAKEALGIYKQWQQTPKIARIYYVLGSSYRLKSEFDTAIKYLEDGIILSDQTKNSDIKRKSLNILAVCYKRKGEYNKAVLYYEQSIDLAQKLNDRKGEAIALGNLGILYLDIKDYVKSLPYIEKAISINEILENHNGLTANYGVMGDSYTMLGDQDKALSFYDKALKIASKIGNRTDENYLIRKIAVVAKESAAAFDYFEKAIVEDEKAGDFEKVISNYRNLAFLCQETSSPTKGIEYANKALAIALKTGNRNAEIDCYENLSLYHKLLGNYVKAIDYLQKIITLNERLKSPDATKNFYFHILEIYTTLNDLDKAIDYGNKGLIEAKKMSDKGFEAVLLNRLSVVYKQQKKYEEALECMKKSNEIHKILGNTKSLNENAFNLGTIYYAMGDYVNAHRFFQEALIHYRKFEIKSNFAGVLMSIADIYIYSPDSIILQLGINPSERYTKATALLTEALELSTKKGYLDRKQAALYQLSILHEKKGDYIKAYDTYKQYITLKDSLSGDEVKKQITRKEIQFEFDKKETELKYQQQLTAGELEKQRLLTAQQEQDLLLNRQNLTLKEQALTLSNREKDLAHLAYLKEQAEKQEKTQQLSLSEEREKGKERDLSLKNLELSAQQKQNLYLGLLATVLLGGLGTLFYFYNALKKQKNIIAQQNELNEHTIAILSHDIKEPLLGVKLMLKKLNKDDPFVAQASQSLENQINSVNGILTNLLKMKKLSLTKKDKNAQADAYTVVKNVLQELNVAIQTKELTIENELTEGVLLPIAPEKLQIIVHNLLSNAVKYSFPNQKIRIFQEGKGFCIQDFGIGLSPEQRSKLMREVTASQQGTKQERGNGLGLFLVGAMLQGEAIKVVFDSPEVGGTVAKILG